MYRSHHYLYANLRRKPHSCRGIQSAYGRCKNPTSRNLAMDTTCAQWNDPNLTLYNNYSTNVQNIYSLLPTYYDSRKQQPQLSYSMDTTKRWNSSATTTTTASISSIKPPSTAMTNDHKTTVTSTTVDPVKTTVDATDSSTDDDTPHTSTMREKIRDRIHDTRTAAAAQIKEFRDHPAQSAKEGAKSFSGMLRKYGPVFVGTYGCVYFTTLGLLFSGVQSGILDPLALFQYLGSHNPSEHGVETATTVHLVVDWMEHHDITKPYAPYVEKNPAFANFAVAWIAVKFTEPVRLPTALALTPHVSRFLGYTKETSEESSNNTNPPPPPSSS